MTLGARVTARIMESWLTLTAGCRPTSTSLTGTITRATMVRRFDRVVLS